MCIYMHINIYIYTCTYTIKQPNMYFNPVYLAPHNSQFEPKRLVSYFNMPSIPPQSSEIKRCKTNSSQGSVFLVSAEQAYHFVDKVPPFPWFLTSLITDPLKMILSLCGG